MDVRPTEDGDNYHNYLDAPVEVVEKYPTASLTADLVVFRVHTDAKNQPTGADVLLIERGGEPFKGALALPGGFVNASNFTSDLVDQQLHVSTDDVGETFLQAAIRELKEETNLTPATGLLERVGIYDAPGRDPRGRVISTAFMVMLLPEETTDAKAGDDAARLEWVDVTSLDTVDLAFDHGEIVRDALAMVGLVSPAAL